MIKSLKIFTIITASIFGLITSCGEVSHQQEVLFSSPSTIEFDLNRGSGNFPKIYKTTLYIFLPTEVPYPPNEDVVFVGWENEAEDIYYKAGSYFSYSEDTTLRAVWYQKCHDCHGEGENHTYGECDICHGVGYSLEEVHSTCPTCKGSGQVKDERMCSKCHGAGTLDIFRCNYGHTIYEPYQDYVVSLCPYCADLGRISIMTLSGSYDCPDCIGGYNDYGYKNCNTCSGTGIYSYNYKHTCDTCSGTGKVVTSSQKCQTCYGLRYARNGIVDDLWRGGSIYFMFDSDTLEIKMFHGGTYNLKYALVDASLNIDPNHDLTYKETSIVGRVNEFGATIYFDVVYFLNLIYGKEYHLYIKARYDYSDSPFDPADGPIIIKHGISYSYGIGYPECVPN